MKKRLLITMTALMLVTVTMMAVPAKPGLKKMVKKADGSTVELTLHGDEHYSFYKDAAGTPFQIVNGFAKKITPEEVTTKWTARKKENLNQGAANSRRANRVGAPTNSTTGRHKGLVILLEFKDVKFSKTNVKEIYQRFFNEEGYNEGGMAGSVRDYFLAQSYDQLTIDFDVVGPYTTTYDLEHYGAPVKDESGEETKHDKNAPLAMKEAVEHAISEPSLDFSDYDWDGNGVVDQVFIIFAGHSQAQGADANSIWPHEFQLSGYNLAGKDKNGNSVAISTYGCASELSGDSGKDLDGIGTACHEFSHCLGLPDMYDTDYSGGFGMSYWDIMDSGSYLDDSCTPAGYTSYERWFSNWMEPIEIKEMTQISDMEPLATPLTGKPKAYVLYNDAKEKSIKGEYYLLENRQPVGFDAKLYGHGLLILHVDYNKSAWESNSVNDNPDHQRLTIIPADNEFGQQRYKNAKTGEIYSPSIAGDPWPGTSGNTMLGNHTTPAATLYNANTDGSKLMNKQIDNITENPTEVQGVNTISFVACRPELPAPSADEATEQVEDNSLTISWPKVEGAVSYDVEWTIKDKAPKTPEQALLFESDLAKFEGKETYTAITGSLTSYGLDSWTAEQLGIGTVSPVSRRAASTVIHSTPTNSITMPVDINKIYFYRIRSIDEEGFHSAWSDEKTFDLETTGIQSISMKVANDNTVRYYDLQGHEVSPETKGLLIRKQGNEVKKVIKQ